MNGTNIDYQQLHAFASLMRHAAGERVILRSITGELFTMCVAWDLQEASDNGVRHDPMGGNPFYIMPLQPPVEEEEIGPDVIENQEIEAMEEELIDWAVAEDPVPN